MESSRFVRMPGPSLSYIIPNTKHTLAFTMSSSFTSKPMCRSWQPLQKPLQSTISPTVSHVTLTKMGSIDNPETFQEHFSCMRMAGAGCSVTPSILIGEAQLTSQQLPPWSQLE
ncbi:uncharacterized [Tachysurus ichikawai]